MIEKDYFNLFISLATLMVSFAVFILVGASIKTAVIAILSIFGISVFKCGLCGCPFLARIDDNHECPAIYWTSFRPNQIGELVCKKCAPIAERLNEANKRLEEETS